VSRRWVGRALRISGFAGAAFLFWLFAIWPPPAWYRTHFPRETAFMAMRRGQADEDTPERRYQPVPIDQIARSMREAALVAEDHRFYLHGGVDYQAIREALGYRRDDFAWDDPKDRTELKRALGRAWERRDRIRGASTITQQLAKNLYLSPSRNPLRKVKEAVTAWRLEAALEKDRLLELYLNVVELGPEIWGVEAASQKYFRKSARRLTSSEAALLAATLPGPLRANPGYRVGRIRWRQQLILRRMMGEEIVVPRDEDAQTGGRAEGQGDSVPAAEPVPEAPPDTPTQSQR
jgi:monofunctional biosynthetic peptidoglycan transglycosylase